MHATSDPSRKNMRKFLVFNLMFTILSPRFRCSSSNESLFFHRSYSRCSQVEWTRAFVTGVFSLPPICFPWHIFFSSCRCIAPIRTLFCGSVTNVPATHPNTLWLVFFPSHECLENGYTIKWVCFSQTQNDVQCSAKQTIFPQHWNSPATLWMVWLSIHDNILCFRNFI